MNPLNTQHNKAVWSGAAMAAINLINGRLPPDLALSADEIGWAMTILGVGIAWLVKNRAA